MSTLTDDIVVAPSRVASGLVLAILSAASFALSGPLAKGLIDTGWTAGAAVTARITIAAVVLAVPAALSLRGRWHLLRGNVGLVVAYGMIAVAGCQLAYFSSVARMDVGVAILIEFTSPLAVLVWMWTRHGQRPGRLTIAGAVAALAGLLLVLDLFSGVDVDLVGVAWALGAMLGAAFYWIISADEDNGLPGLVLAAGGLSLGAIVLVVAGAVGIVPVAMSSDDVLLGGAQVAWWIPVVALGVVTAAAAYVLGIAATRRLGSRLASFVGLSEAVTSVVFAWLLLDQAPATIQLAGGVLILLGVVAVRLGEPATRHAAAEDPHAP